MSVQQEEQRLIKIAVIHTEFPQKFGVPRQSRLTAAKGRIVLEPEYREPEALRGIEEYSHLWLIWGFSKVSGERWRPTVRPPRLGGNIRKGVFATRSPFRPNRLGLSCVRLLSVEQTEKDGPVLWVEGVDMVDQTPIYDIKPYLPYADAVPDASGGFADQAERELLEVEIPEEWLARIPEEKKELLKEVLAQDPRPSYQKDPERIYGMAYGGMDVKFRVNGSILTVCGVSGETDLI